MGDQAEKDQCYADRDVASSGPKGYQGCMEVRNWLNLVTRGDIRERSNPV